MRVGLREQEPFEEHPYLEEEEEPVFRVSGGRAAKYQASLHASSQQRF